MNGPQRQSIPGPTETSTNRNGIKSIFYAAAFLTVTVK